MEINTLFILRERDEPLSVGDVIIAQGLQKYQITVKQIIDTKLLGNKVQWKIKGVREAIVTSSHSRDIGDQENKKMLEYMISYKLKRSEFGSREWYYELWASTQGKTQVIVPANKPYKTKRETIVVAEKAVADMTKWIVRQEEIAQ